MIGQQPDARGRAWARAVDDSEAGAIAGTVTSRFAASVRTAGSSVALLQDDEVLTYDELDRRSNQVARVLRGQEVGRGSVVAVSAGRSIGSLVVLLATLKAGAGYAPLDPEAPAEYRDWMVQNCAACVMVTDRAPAGSPSVRTLDLASLLAAAEGESQATLDDLSTPADIAYVMYTSGSTGRPKGVQVPHRAVVRLVVDQAYARFAADEVFLHAAPLSFDASTFEIWGALLHGARLAVVADGHASLDRIADTIRRHGVTTAWFTAGLFHLLVEHRLAALSGVRQILAGGDVLSPSHVQRAQAALPDCQIINGYGPTENTTFTCCFRVPREGWGGGPVPIGTPINGTHVRLLDDDMRPVADGEIGVLYAGGLGLASGYIGAAHGAATGFVADPRRPGAMLYRTGDLARRRPDGALDFLGRRDRQIKVDGKRVEPGEIEEALRHGGGVADAVIVVEREEGISPRLTAYIKPAAAACDRAILVSEVRNQARQSLPAYMQPAQIVVVDDFPLTPNGKVDLRRLPSPALPAPAPGPARQGAERVLEEILARLLGVASIAPDTSFFDLGATSLRLMEAHAAIVRIWPEIDIVALFRHPTLRALARAVEARGARVETPAQRRGQAQAEALKRLQQGRAAR